MPADLLVRNARLAGRDGVFDLAIEGDRFARIGTGLDVDAKETLDAEGRLASPPLVDCHLHLDASLTAGKPRHNESGTLLEGIQVWGELKPSLTIDDVVSRATEIVRWSAAQGTLFIRAHADVSVASVDLHRLFSHRSHGVGQALRGAARSVNLLPMVDLDDLGVEAWAEPPQRELGELREHLDSEAHVGGPQDWDCLRGFV